MATGWASLETASTISSLTDGSSASRNSRSSEVNWWFLQFTHKSLQRRYKRFRLISSHNNFPFSYYLSWVLLNTVTYGYFIFPYSVDMSNPLLVLIPFNIATVSMILNYLVLLFRTRLGVRLLSKIEAFADVNHALEWRNVFEELACFLRVLSTGLIIAARSYKGQCPEVTLRTLDFYMCNAMAKQGTPPLDMIAAMYFNFFVERNWFTATRLEVSYLLLAVIVANVAASYYFIFTSPDMTTSPGIHVPPNVFVFVCTAALGPHCFNTERAGLEKFLLATRSDGGEAAESLVKKGEEVNYLDEHKDGGDDHSDILGDAIGGRSGRPTLTSLRVPRSSIKTVNRLGQLDDDEGEMDIQEHFGSIMQSLKPDDIERVVSSVAQDELMDAQNMRDIQQKLSQIRQDREQQSK